jgi:hypothetical protein
MPCSPAGPWQANTRYQITVTIRNPAAPAALPATAEAPPGLWMAPLQYILQHNSSGQVVSRHVRVRGDKLGQVCSLRRVTAKCSSIPQCSSKILQGNIAYWRQLLLSNGDEASAVLGTSLE